MPKTREEIQADIQEVMKMANPENQARMSELLTGISREFEAVLTESENFANRVQELTQNNEELRKVNTDLFLEVGKLPTPAANPQPKIESDLPEITFDKLFNEKGELL